MIRNYLFLGIAILALPGVFSCKSGENNQTKEQPPSAAIKTINPDELISNETKLLLDYLNELGDYVNSRQFPSLIKASSVNEGLDANQLVLDIRTPESYKKGHIKGARNIKFETIPDYFESTIIPFEFDKIIIVSEGGQSSSYATCLLRLMGYGNVYSLRWGMSGWNNEFARDGWFAAIGSDFQDKLETKIYPKAEQHKLPVLSTGGTTGEEVLLARAKQLFSEGIASAHVTSYDVFANTGEFYIMNYIRRDKYEAGHIPGAIRYKPQATLGIVKEMSTIPTDKTSVVYCGTGHNSGFVTAYLRLFGYDAKTLMYGNNSFMYDKMVAERDVLSWLPFTDEAVENYPFEK